MLLLALREALHRAGYTQVQAAKALGISVATLRRWLAGQGATLANISALCRLAGVGMADLVSQSSGGERYPPLTLAQEQALATDPALSTVFFVIVAGWPPEEATPAFAIPEEMVRICLERLHRLALIDMLAGGRVRARLDPSQIWEREPLRRHFDLHMKKYFFDVDYASPDVRFGMETVKLSPLGMAEVHNLIEEFRRDIRAIATRDRQKTHLPAEWFGVLAIARTLGGLKYDPAHGQAKPRKP